MENDNSMLAQVCDQWGKLKNGPDNIGKWSNGDFGADSEERLYNHAVSVQNTYYWLLGRVYDYRWECDDYNRGVKTAGRFLESVCSLNIALIGELGWRDDNYFWDSILLPGSATP